MFSKLETLLLGIALLGFATHGWTQDGTVIAWGDNRYGQTNVPSGLSNVVAIAAGEWHNMALRADGTLIGWGVNNAGQRDVPSDLTNVEVIATGGYHNLAVKADGTVRAWGQNEFGQTNVPAGLNNVVAVEGGWSHSVALKADGKVVAWGRNNEGQATVPFGLTNVVAIAAGEYHNLALKADGTVTGWGWNGFGQTTVPASLGNNVVAIAASGMHSLALKTDGTVTAWGWNGFGQTTVPAGLSDVATIAAGAEHSLAIKSDGTVVAWGANTAWKYNDPNCQIIGHPCEREYSGQVDVPAGLGNVVAIAGGNFHSVALRANSTSSPPVRLTLTKNISPAGSGSINAAPASGDGKYNSNTVVTLTAVPAANNIFTGWSGAATGTNNPIQITMNGDKTITATFAPAFTLTANLTVNVNPSSAGVVYATPPSLWNSYPAGTVVTLTAQPEGTNVFAAWYGDVSGVSNQIDVVMNTNKTVNALFNNPGKFVFQHTDRRLAVWFLQNTQRVAAALLNDGRPVGSNWRLTGAGDLDSNGSKDLFFRGTNGQLAIWLMDGNHRTSSVLWNTGQVVPVAWRLAGSDDFNSDGKADILWHNTRTGVLNVWLMNGITRTSAVRLTNTVGPLWRVAATANFDADNSPDIVFQRSDGRIAIWLMNGYVRGSSVLLRNGVTAGPGFVAVGVTDIDDDGNTDIVFQHADGIFKVWFMEGATFNREVTLSARVNGWKLRGVK
ncbi:MAG: hypothetical protein H0X66_06435 [Verrucomicrobia bacterium]|nr:hypothetical protein [Verrucomicrobiota bacterium]